MSHIYIKNDLLCAGNSHLAGCATFYVAIFLSLVFAPLACSRGLLLSVTLVLEGVHSALSLWLVTAHTLPAVKGWCTVTGYNHLGLELELSPCCPVSSSSRTFICH